jgi:Domain of unknown function (DUF3786)
MAEQSKIFEENYQDYCRQIASVDLASIKTRLEIQVEDNVAQVQFFNQTCQVSGLGIFNTNNEKADYATCVILAKYILLCPDQLHLDSDWCTFRDFKKESHFTNTNIFNSDTIQKITTHFSGRLPDLKAACEKANGTKQEMGLAYDLSVSFTALPRLSLLLLFNDADEDFPSDCKVLFQKQAEYYLDPESLAMTSGLLARQLIQADEKKEGGANG